MAEITGTNIVIIDGVECDIETLPNRDEIVDYLNTTALKKFNYVLEDETA